MKERLVLASFVVVFLFAASDGSASSNKGIFENYERAIRFQISEAPKSPGKDVYGPLAYIDRPERNKPIWLICVPPKQENEGQNAYDGLAIYKGQGDHIEAEEICKSPVPAAPLLADRGGVSGVECSNGTAPHSIELRVLLTSNYTCKYIKDTEPPATPAVIQINFQNNGSVQAFNEENRPIDIPTELKKGKRPRFVCPGADQKDTMVKWYRNEDLLKSDANYEVNDTNFNLTFKPKENRFADGSRFGGWYKCERWTKDEKVLLASSFFKINSPAHVTPVKPSYNHMQGDTTQMACVVQGEPTPSVRWERRKDGQSTDLSKDERVKFGVHKGVANAAVEIKDLTEDDYGSYVCIAESGGGQHHAEADTLLRVRSRLAALWPFLGIVAEVIILVAVIFIYEKRRMKKEQQEDTEDTIDQKKSLTAANNESKDIRQRKA